MRKPSSKRKILTGSLPLLLLVAAVSATRSTASAQEPVAESVSVASTGGWAVLSGGRRKPLETHAREIVRSVSGRSKLGGLNALEVFWGFNLDAPNFRTRDFIRVDSKDLKLELGLDAEQRRFSFDALMGNAHFRELIEAGYESQAAGLELAPLSRDALATYDKLERVAAIIRGESLAIVPGATPGGDWVTPDSLRGAHDPERAAVYEGFVALTEAYRSGDGAAFEERAEFLGGALRRVAPDAYPAPAELDRELLYNHLGAFGMAWKLYLLAFFTLLFFGLRDGKLGRRLGLTVLAGGFLFHAVGLGLRWQIAGRAPVSDMYESLVFMGLGVIVLGFILELASRKGYFGLCAGLMGFVALAFAENLPIDSSINPLVPVLANTSWLSIHVMTIMLSYSAFAIAMAMGHVALGVQFFKPGKTALLRTFASLLYRTLVVGVLFLAAGIAFGAIWANESWGRYWGWDPKETWSLITFFIYMALVHARFAKWIHNFGLAILSIVGFLFVLMTYYGVNFVLGAGLHSYGFAEGGMVWVLSFLLIELAIIAAATIRYRSTLSGGRGETLHDVECPV